MAITYSPVPISVQQLVTAYEKGDLNLAPGFQRDSVWGESDRRKLVESIVQNFPLPAIFLHKRVENGEIRFDVIDGKQRIESILMFMGLKRGKFSVKLRLNGAGGDETARLYDWAKLKRRRSNRG